MKKLMLVAALGLSASAVLAQTMPGRCGIDAVRAHMAEHDPSLLQTMTSRIAPDEEAPLALTTNDYETVTIPVVFHLLLTQSQLDRLGGVAGVERRISSQIAVLNEDFSAENSDSTKIPDVFKPLYGNARIRFGLARRHHQTGAAFAGYQLKVLSPGTDTVYNIFGGSAGSRYFCSDAKYDSQRGFAAWPTDKYLNIWVVRITENGREGVVGITTPPSFTNTGQVLARYPEEVGVVLTYGVLGRRSSTMDFFFQRDLDRGRTATHEVGNFFELEHVWGVSDGCGTDDGIADTPPQDQANYLCPSFPQQNCTNSPGGEMFMNFMDYVNDGCMHLFTKGQVARMRQQLVNGGKSYSLTQHPELTEWPTGVSDPNWVKNVLVAPNPAHGFTMVYVSDPEQLREVSVWDMMGQLVKTVPLHDLRDGVVRVDLSGLASGIYSIRCQFATETISNKIVVR